MQEKRYFSVLGDSISTLEGVSIPEYAAYYDTVHKLEAGVFTLSDTWWGQVIERLGGELLVNNSFSGSTVCWHRHYEIQSYGCSEERTSGLDRDGHLPDIIMIFMGINDWGRGMRISPKEEEGEDLSFFSVAYRRMLEQLKSNYPAAELWCFTLPVSACKKREDFAFPYTYGGIHIEEYCKVIRACAEQGGARLIDLYRAAKPYDTIDGFHPTAEGMKTLAEALFDWL